MLGPLQSGDLREISLASWVRIPKAIQMQLLYHILQDYSRRFLYKCGVDSDALGFAQDGPVRFALAVLQQRLYAKNRTA